jgi:hypothetical protein
MTFVMDKNPFVVSIKVMKNITIHPSRSKYGNKAVEMDGRRFASKREAARYAELALLQRIGTISSLECQPRFPLVVNGVKVATYVADFRYQDSAGKVVIEDVKSDPTRTPIYRLKAKLLLALHGISITEV